MPDETPHLLPESGGGRDRLGITTITLRYIVKGGSADDGSDEPWDTLHDWMPGFSPLGLGYMDRKMAKRQDGDWNLDITFEGAKNDQSLAAYAEIDYSRVDQPIESHPKIADLMKNFGGSQPAGQNQLVWKKEIQDPDTGKMVKNPMLGITHYLDANVVLRTTFAVQQFNRALFEGMCKIDDPITPKGLDEIAAVANEKLRWLKTSIKASWRGNVWALAVEWMLGEWNLSLYSLSGTEQVGKDFRSGADNPQGGIAGGAFA